MTVETVLVAVNSEDDERVEQLAETAVQLAEPSGATVAVAHVYDADEYADLRERLEYGPQSEATPDRISERHTTVRALGERLDAAGVEWEAHGRLVDGGEPGDGIVDLATELEADRVVVSGERRSPAGKAMFGSTPQRVLLNSPAPVTFVRAA